MSEGEQNIVVEAVPLLEVAEELRGTLPFSGTNFDDLGNVGPVERVTAKAGTVLVEIGEAKRAYWVVLEGEVRAERPEPDGSQTLVGLARRGEGFGETPLLTGKTHMVFTVQATQDSVLVRFGEDGFWSLMACCPSARKVILSNMAQRLQTYQVEALHKEKLISLGTLAAGLMHELHNPGSAAKRASSQLRVNLLKLQQLSLRFSDEPKTPIQLECMRSLLEHTVHGCHAPAMSSIEQSDAEEAMAEWLTAAGVENAYS